MRIDPRENGFNYGVPVPIQNVELVDTLSEVANVLRDEAMKASRVSWNFDMALRRVQHSTSVEEQSKNLEKLRNLVFNLE